MRTHTSILFIVAMAAVLPASAKAADAEGCVDVKPVPRLEGCVIQECSAKPHDSFETPDGSGGPVEANTNTLSYTCPTSIDLTRVRRELDTATRKAGYQNVAEEKNGTVSFAVTARRGSHWIRWGAGVEEGTLSYNVTIADGASEKWKAEACGQSPILSSLKQCEVVECSSKAEDSVAMRTATKEKTSLTGSVETITLACPALSAAQAFSAAEDGLKVSGFEILFSDREHPENGWMTGRAGKKWVELASAPDGESVSYALTVVPSADVLTASKIEPAIRDPGPALAAVAETVTLPAPDPAPAPVPASIITPPPSPASTAEPEVRRAPTPVSAPVLAPTPKFVSPTPIFKVAIEPTHDRIYSVAGEVVINMLVDVSEEGAVTKAALTGHITKDVLKLESAALDAISHWRFEPARQDGRIVAAVKIPVQMRFYGKPWRY